MQELINIKNEEAVTTSLMVADVFGKAHKNVLRKIEQIIADELNQPAQNCARCFHKTSYVDAKGERRTMYEINRDGFTFLVMGFTGKKANEWKWKYIEQFNSMEKYINFRKADKQIQKYSMQFLNDNLEMPCPRDFIKANTIADKCVSNMHGYPKMVKKKDMDLEMLEDREPVLQDTVQLMAVKDKFGLDIPISESIYKKYAN